MFLWHDCLYNFRMLTFNKIHFLLFILGIVTLQSCSSIYMPNVPATPMFSEAGEAYVAGHVNLKGNLSGTAAVAVGDHLAVLANGSTVNTGDFSNDYYRQWLVEGAIGYFTKLGKDKRQILELYGGYGIGNAKDYDQRASVLGYEVIEAREMNFDKYFIQVNYSSKRKKKINLFGDQKQLNYGTAIRLSRVGMQDFTIDGINMPTEENYFIEPVFFTRMQLVKGLQLQYTTGFNIGLMNNENLKAGNSIFTLGLVYNFWK